MAFNVAFIPTYIEEVHATTHKIKSILLRNPSSINRSRRFNTDINLSRLAHYIGADDGSFKDIVWSNIFAKNIIEKPDIHHVLVHKLYSHTLRSFNWVIIYIDVTIPVTKIISILAPHPKENAIH